MGRQSSSDETGDYDDSSEYISFLSQRRLPREPSKASRLHKWLRVLFFVSTTIINIAAVIVLAGVYMQRSNVAEEASHVVPSCKKSLSLLKHISGDLVVALRANTV